MSKKLQAYFQRINYTGATEPTLDNLRAIHRAHMMSVPFENLDIHVGRWLVLDENNLFQKFVGERRGGVCYEQNGFFSYMLREMGYDVLRIEANVWNEAKQVYAPPMTHMTLVTTINGTRYLTDVGFGDSFLEPLELDNFEAQTVAGRQFRVEHDGRAGFYYALDDVGNWKVQYRFYIESHELDDYGDACYYTQTSPDTHFTQKRVCSKATPEGRISLSDLRLIERKGKVRTETELQDEAEFEALLLDIFGIDLTAARASANRVMG
jgi:N-hydroxyarylamine O-acetyltransferase